jgi:hypothetical protein
MQSKLPKTPVAKTSGKRKKASFADRPTLFKEGNFILQPRSS